MTNVLASLLSSKGALKSKGKGNIMGAANTTVQNIEQSTLNSITQTSSAACGANCTQVQSGNTVFLNGSTAGNITFNQTCTVDAKCQIDNSVEASATAIQKAIAAGTAKPAFFFGLAQVNTSVQNTVQNVKNIVQQNMDSTCNNGASQVQDANLVFLQNSTSGDIGFNQDTNLTSQCVLSNLAKGTAASTQTADFTAQAGGLGGSTLVAAIVVIVIAIIVIAAIAAAISLAKKKDQQCGGPNQPPCPPGQQSGAPGGGGLMGGGAGGKSMSLGGAVRGGEEGARLGPEGAAAGAALGATGLMPNLGSLGGSLGRFSKFS